MFETPESQRPGFDADRGHSFRAFLISMTVLTSTLVILRFWSRALSPRVSYGNILHRFWWDDWIALFAFVSFQDPDKRSIAC